MNWYVGTDWSVIPAGGNSLRQVFVRLEDYETLKAEHKQFVDWAEPQCKDYVEMRDRISELEAIIARNDAQCEPK